MLKKIILSLAVIFSFSAAAQSLKVGLVDVQSVMESMPETKEASDKLQDIQKKYEAEVVALQNEIQKQYEELQNLGADVLPAVRERKERAAQDQQLKYQQFIQQVQQDLQKQQMELFAPIEQKIRTAIESVGKEGSYSLIQANEPTTTFYYAAPVEDVTPLVKTKLGIR